MLVGIPQADIARGTVAGDSSGRAELRWWASGAVSGVVEPVRVIVVEFNSVRAIVAESSESIFSVESVTISVVGADLLHTSGANEAFGTVIALAFSSFFAPSSIEAGQWLPGTCGAVMVDWANIALITANWSGIP